MTKFPERVLILFPEGTRERVDAVSGYRGSQEFFRDAVEAALRRAEAGDDPDDCVVTVFERRADLMRALAGSSE